MSDSHPKASCSPWRDRTSGPSDQSHGAVPPPNPAHNSAAQLGTARAFLGTARAPKKQPKCGTSPQLNVQNVGPAWRTQVNSLFDRIHLHVDLDGALPSEELHRTQRERDIYIYIIVVQSHVLRSMRLCIPIIMISLHYIIDMVSILAITGSSHQLAILFQGLLAKSSAS